ncbi:MAG: hypothetical protein ACRCXD_15825 [Luteolibacter sp.]
MNPISRWLEPFSWEFVTAQNEVLCLQKTAHHGPTSDGHLPARELWEEARLQEMGLFEVVEVCRKCHRLAPFTNFNGNTFAAIARILVRRLELSPEKEFLARSLAGHIVAGVASEEEVKAFEKFCAALG